MEFDEKLSELRFALGNRLPKAEPCLKGQLRHILKELDQMEQVRNSVNYMPYYPRGIVDAWDFSDDLIEPLFELLALYQKL